MRVCLHIDWICGPFAHEMSVTTISIFDLFDGVRKTATNGSLVGAVAFIIVVGWVFSMDAKSIFPRNVPRQPNEALNCLCVCPEWREFCAINTTHSPASALKIDDNHYATWQWRTNLVFGHWCARQRKLHIFVEYWLAKEPLLDLLQPCLLITFGRM